ncbi:MAG TPA: hypothetical protein VIV12_12010 [Streptosporangiaceae bacterium]
MALVQVQTPGGEGTKPQVTAAAADTSGTTPRGQVVTASFAAILVFWLLGIALNRAFKPTAMVIPAGVSVFAMLYAVTQGLERLLEPVSSFFFSTKDHTQLRNAALAKAVNLQTATDSEITAQLSRAEAQKAAADHAQSVPEKIDPEAARREAVKNAAAMQATLNQQRADKAIAFWALASVLGVLLSATFGLYLLHIVGLRSDGLVRGGWTGPIASAAGIRHMLDLLVTGLAVGGGTKPLHDLITNLQTSKENKKDPGETH